MANIVKIFVHMRYTAWRHSMHGANLAMYIIGSALGLLAALGTDALAFGRSAAATNFLATILSFWWVGWISGAILMGTGTILVSRYFTYAPVAPRKLLSALLVATCAGATTLVTFIAFLAYPLYGSHFGAMPALVGLIAACLGAAFVILCARFVTTVLSDAAQSRARLELTALLIGLIFGLLSSGWVLFIIIKPFARVLAHHTATLYVNLLPTTWGLIAVRAAARHQWWNVVYLLGGLLTLSFLFLMGWLYVERRKMVISSRTSVAVSKRQYHFWTSLLPTNTISAIVLKELAMWSRDVWRARLVRTGLWMGVFICGLPALGHYYAMVPWAGLLMILMGVVPGANIYAYDGSSLWLVMMAPHHFVDDLRARQIAWLITVAPMAILVSLGGTLLTGQWWALPWILALLLAMLGGGAGVSTWLSVYWLVPVTEQRKRGGSALVTGPDMGKLVIQMRVAMLLVLLVAVPPLACVAAGVIWHSGIIVWSGVIVGVIIGVLSPIIVQHYASQQLKLHATELFTRLSHSL